MTPETINQEALQNAHIQIAVLETKVEAQGREIGELKAMIQALGVKLDGVATTLTEARGGWKLMMLLGGGAATFGSVITWIATHLSTKGTP
ncbi:MAG: hypothetical protein KGN32_17160 [Burkholderiales bacterium]|nr:hypothetical protein [Burkholderiales bacterium]